jgi:ferrous iron transport protein A
MRKKRKCLRHMRRHQKCCIARNSACGELGRRLRDMGLVPGAELTVLGRAPLRDPLALRLKDCTLTLRNSEADHIFVDVEEEQ